LTIAAVTLLLKLSPRRRQPGYSWLRYGGVPSVLLWVAASLLLALYIEGSGSFGATYGPLAGIMALLLWAVRGGAAGGVRLRRPARGGARRRLGQRGTCRPPEPPEPPEPR
jgi:hypothetical protein